MWVGDHLPLGRKKVARMLESHEGTFLAQVCDNARNQEESLWEQLPAERRRALKVRCLPYPPKEDNPVWKDQKGRPRGHQHTACAQEAQAFKFQISGRGCAAQRAGSRCPSFHSSSPNPSLGLPLPGSPQSPRNGNGIGSAAFSASRKQRCC